MTNHGKNTEAGFLPTAPSMDDIMSRANFIKDGFKSLSETTAGKHLSDGIDRPSDELKRRYARLFNGSGNEQDAIAVVEDILDKTLRRAPVMPKPGMTFEQLTPYMVERYGQNGVVIYILKMIQDGIDMPPPETKNKKNKK